MKGYIRRYKVGAKKHPRRRPSGSEAEKKPFIDQMLIDRFNEAMLEKMRKQQGKKAEEGREDKKREKRIVRTVG
jgi:hypothetical protein